MQSMMEAKWRRHLRSAVHRLLSLLTAPSSSELVFFFACALVHACVEGSLNSLTFKGWLPSLAVAIGVDRTTNAVAWRRGVLASTRCFRGQAMKAAMKKAMKKAIK